mmetsp:Transcript_12743/g.32680  ORF Transcript_12743/g.32680 Transcript_12743/m.32680 type:complete len:529 (+) Transcript_12743:123-1709(+)
MPAPSRLAVVPRAAALRRCTPASRPRQPMAAMRLPLNVARGALARPVPAAGVWTAGGASRSAARSLPLSKTSASSEPQRDPEDGLPEAHDEDAPDSKPTVTAASPPLGGSTKTSDEAPFLERLRQSMIRFGSYALLSLMLTATGVQVAVAALPPPLPPHQPAPAVVETARSAPPQDFMGTSAPDLSAELAQLDLNVEETATVRLFNANKASVVYITNVGLRQNNITLDVEKVPRGTGSGFVWDDRGHIVTNFHVIQGATDLRVALIDQNVYPARVVNAEPDKDVAVLELEAPEEVIKSLTPVQLGSSARLQVGQQVFAIGNPFGLDHTLTSGIISGLGREISSPSGFPIRGVIQTDAAINPGNSGGVLLDSKGRLVGINTAIADPTGSGSSSGVGFAIPIDTVKGLVGQILEYGQVMRPSLGVTIAPTQLTQQLGSKGVLILDVQRGGAAAKAGLQPTYRDDFGRIVLGDIIVEFNGTPIVTEKDLFEALDGCRVGQSVPVKVVRGGKVVSATLQLANRAQQKYAGVE